MAFIRLQGVSWETRKHKLKINEMIKTANSVRLNCYDPKTREYFSHYLNEKELSIYNEFMQILEDKLLEKNKIAFSSKED